MFYLEVRLGKSRGDHGGTNQIVVETGSGVEGLTRDQKQGGRRLGKVLDFWIPSRDMSEILFLRRSGFTEKVLSP